MSEYLLMEDDCAPDAREYFDKGVRELCGHSMHEFFCLGKKSEPDELTTEHSLDGYCLVFHGDDPFYKLKKNGAKRPNREVVMCELRED